MVICRYALIQYCRPVTTKYKLEIDMVSMANYPFLSSSLILRHVDSAPIT